MPILNLIHFIDRRIKPGSYKALMQYFSLFYSSKIIPLNTKINSQLYFSPTEEILEIVKRVPAASIGYCYCRIKHKNCDNPIWTCIHIGTAKHLEELGKKIPLKSASYKEIEQLLFKADELGLIHQLLTAPSPEYVYVICNCCQCCCVMLQNAIKYNLHGAVIESNFLVEKAKEECHLCKDCISKCYFNAIEIVNETIVIHSEKCRGCGLCVNACKQGNLKLIRKK
ncbi:MAG: DUF362 domain-containing protein [Candidatus Thorarchaeota archaeon]